MALSLPLVWADEHRLHEPSAEIWVGVRTPAAELPARADAIRATLLEAGATEVAAVPHDDAPLEAVHDPGLLAFLASAWADWEAAGLPTDPGQDQVVPYIFPHPGLLGGLEPQVPAATWARPGAFCFDTMTLIGPGTWAAARAAADAALTAADLVAGGAPLVYACCRPPGHHVTRTAYGGSCYLNNAAIAAQQLRAGGAARVAVIDIDAHHGNGAQSIFWERNDILTASVHVDPATGWFPHFLGGETERGSGDGLGSNLNVPLPPGARDDEWLRAVDVLVQTARSIGAEALVLALGVDAAGGDPESPLDVTVRGFRQAGRLLGQHGLPIVVVQEGGYDLASIGGLVLATLEGLQEGHGNA
jgi:acetoin utilization deacetylase AcuC-like enzyme